MVRRVLDRQATRHRHWSREPSAGFKGERSCLRRMPVADSAVTGRQCNAATRAKPIRPKSHVSLGHRNVVRVWLFAALNLTTAARDKNKGADADSQEGRWRALSYLTAR